MGRLVGIDLGTTNSVVAVMEGSQVRILHNRENSQQTRSIVGLKKRRKKTGAQETETLVGDTALANWPLAVSDTIVSIKRLMGRGVADPEVQRIRGFAQYKIVEPSDGTKDSIRVLMGGAEYSPIDISAMILRKLKEDAEFALGEEVTHAVITVPAYFSHIQKDATRKAGTKAGLNVIKILDEPTAAAIAYGLDSDDPGATKTILVYDLGGGTFDISILVMSGGVFAPLNLEGNMWLGGDNFDQKLIEHAISSVEDEFAGIDPTSNPEFMAALKRACQKAKETLTSSRSADIIVSGILKHEGDLVDVDLEVTLEEYEKMIQPLVDETVSLVEKALANANLTADQIDAVLMAGNSTATPLVQRTIEAMFGPAKMLRKMHPKHCVAIGAAIVAAVIGPRVVCGAPDPADPTRECGNTNQPDAEVCARCGSPLAPPEPIAAFESFVDIAPFHYGARGAGDTFTVFVGKGDPYPTGEPQMHVFRTRAPNARMISIPIYGGDDLERASANERQGEAFAILPPGLPAGTPIRIRLWLDQNGVCQLSAHLEDGTDLEPWVVEKGEAQERAVHALEDVERLISEKAADATPEEMLEIKTARDRVFDEMRAGRFTEALHEVERASTLASAVGVEGMDVMQKASALISFTSFVLRQYGWAYPEIRVTVLGEMLDKLKKAMQEKDPEVIETRADQLEKEVDDIPSDVRLLLGMRHVLGVRVHPYDPATAVKLGSQLGEAEEDLKNKKPGVVERVEAFMEELERVIASLPVPSAGVECPNCGTSSPGRFCQKCGEDTWGVVK